MEERGPSATLGSDDPAVVLRAVNALHRLAEQVEARGVRLARESGWSWEQIGDALGVSRQSVHVKYGKESLTPASPVRPGRRFPPLTSGARAVIKRALGLGKPRRRGRLSSAHFLLALLALRAPDPAAALLDETGVDRAVVGERLGSPGGRGKVA
jgi:Homeodomain-like domain